MTPKEKAEELVDKYIDLQDENLKECDYRFAKLCALIAVDEILEATWKEIRVREKVTYSLTGYDDVVRVQYDKFWNEVKKEIEKL